MNLLRTRAAVALLLIPIAGMAAAQQQRQQRNLAARVPADVEVIRDVEYGKGGDTSLMLDIVRPKTQPKDPMPVVVFIHGGGWQRGDKQSGLGKLILLVQKGYFGASINYRLTDIAPFPAQIEDCKCAIRWVRAHAKEYNLDADHIGVWGGSAGGHLVALLGTSGGVKEFEGKGGWEKYSSRVQAVVDYYGMTDFLAIDELVKKGIATERFMRRDGKDSASGLLGGPFWENPDLCRRASPTTYASKDDPPFLIFHGDKDPLTPASQGELLNKRLRKAGAESHFYLVKDGKHGWPPRPDVDNRVDEFFDKHLRGGQTAK